MSIDFDEWFDNLEINPVYIIQTNLDIERSDDNIKQMKSPEPSKLYHLLKRSTEYKLRKRTKKLIQRIKLTMTLST